MEEIQEYSNVMIGSSLCLLGSFVLIEGSLSILGVAVFIPMAFGGFGLLVSNLMRISAIKKLAFTLQEKFYEHTA